MFSKILVCTDLSPASDALIECVAELKALGMREAILAHVTNVANTSGLEELLGKELNPDLDRQRKVLEDQGIVVTVETSVGLPVSTLDAVAERHDVSAILIGSHGKGILRAATLGSVSEKLLHQTRRPVLLARINLLQDGKCHLVCRSLFSNILFPTDFSEVAERALNYLADIAAEVNCPVTVLHVMEREGSEAEIAASEECRGELLEAKRRRLESLSGAHVSAKLAFGKAAKEIVSAAKEGNFSLIVIGSHGKSFRKELIMGSVVNEVVRHAELPILFLPVLS